MQKYIIVYSKLIVKLKFNKFQIMYIINKKIIIIGITIVYLMTKREQINSMKISKIPQLKTKYLFMHKNKDELNNLKYCTDCIHYIGDVEKCGLFGKLNIVNGKIENQYASKIRNDEEKCGKASKYFIKNNFKSLSSLFYFAKKYWFYMFIVELLINN